MPWRLLPSGRHPLASWSARPRRAGWRAAGTRMAGMRPRCRSPARATRPPAPGRPAGTPARPVPAAGPGPEADGWPVVSVGSRCPRRAGSAGGGKCCGMCAHGGEGWASSSSEAVGWMRVERSTGLQTNHVPGYAERIMHLFIGMRSMTMISQYLFLSRSAAGYRGLVSWEEGVEISEWRRRFSEVLKLMIINVADPGMRAPRGPVQSIPGGVRMGAFGWQWVVGRRTIRRISCR